MKQSRNFLKEDRNLDRVNIADVWTSTSQTKPNQRFTCAERNPAKKMAV